MTNVQLDKFYQHQDGGLYQVSAIATSTEDGVTQLVIYNHTYPFEQRLWARPMVEWTTARFRQLTHEEVRSIMLQDRDTLKQQIADHKKARKQQEQEAQRNLMLDVNDL